MKTYLECIPCFFKQAIRAARLVTDDEELIKRLLDEVGVMLKEIPLDSKPPEMARLVYGKIKEITGNEDPYRELKKENIEKALSLYPALKSRVEDSRDRLLTAVRIAIAGNIMDFGVYSGFDIEREVEEVMSKDLAVCDYKDFRRCLDETDEILYIGDNAGEAVFDRVLIEELGKPVKYAVRGVPVINDATLKDAALAGIGEIATIISSGTSAPGTLLDDCSIEFKKILENSRLVISKGQGNYEGLSEEGYSIFFLLKVKCFVIAGDIGAREGDVILKGININP
ncbi:MAG: DUF89 family protein [Candidatus Krumholzibacteria bacterium]|nr:DUF89 family protein [Candidatus Krumholzibacteria bacterium]